MGTWEHLRHKIGQYLKKPIYSDNKFKDSALKFDQWYRKPFEINKMNSHYCQYNNILFILDDGGQNKPEC